MHRIAVINGPNMAALGRREPDVYGSEPLSGIMGRLAVEAADLGAELHVLQYDNEGEIIGAVGREAEGSDALIINPGALSHVSLAIMDAMKAFPGPVIEVHISNVHSREPFRRRLITAMGADAVISGAGPMGYSLALTLAVNLLRR